MVEFDASEEEFRKLYDKISEDNEEKTNENSANTSKAESSRGKGNEEAIPWQKSILYYLHDMVYLLAVVVVAFLVLFRVVIVSGTSINSNFGGLVFFALLIVAMMRTIHKKVK